MLSPSRESASSLSPQAASENNTTIAVRNADADLAVATLKDEFASELASGMFNDIVAERNLATVAVVGENMKHTTGLAGKLFNTVGRNGINVIACAQGASETNISFVIDHKSLRKALNVIHDSFFLSECQVLNVFITGIGNVGSSLLSQISKQQDKLLKEKNLRLNVVGIASSKRAVFNRDGIDITRYRTLLQEEGIEATPEMIKGEILKMNIFNSVFVDCTASPDIAGLYQDLLEHNVSVVAANKIAASGPYESYRKLKETARRKDVKYLFRDQRRRRPAHHQHHQLPHKFGRPHPQDRGRRFGHPQLYLQRPRLRRAVEPGRGDGERGRLLRARPAHRP